MRSCAHPFCPWNLSYQLVWLWLVHFSFERVTHFSNWPPTHLVMLEFCGNEHYSIIWQSDWTSDTVLVSILRIRNLKCDCFGRMYFLYFYGCVGFVCFFIMVTDCSFIIDMNTLTQHIFTYDILCRRTLAFKASILCWVPFLGRLVSRKLTSIHRIKYPDFREYLLHGALSKFVQGRSRKISNCRKYMMDVLHCVIYSMIISLCEYIFNIIK